MVDFAAHFTIHSIEIGFQKNTFYLESVVLKVIAKVSVVSAISI